MSVPPENPSVPLHETRIDPEALSCLVFPRPDVAGGWPCASQGAEGMGRPDLGAGGAGHWRMPRIQNCAVKESET